MTSTAPPSAPQLRLLGGGSEAPVMEDREGGHRRGHLPGERGTGDARG